MIPGTFRRCAAMLLVAGALHAQGAKGVQPVGTARSGSDVELSIDLRYAEVARDHRRNLLDLYKPKGVANPPLVMFVHGGGWTAGHKDLYQALGEAIARQGIACAPINTQLKPFAKPAEMAADAARAFAWLHAHAGELGFDEQRMYVMGHSSGAHLVSWLALDTSLQRACGVPPGSVRGVIALSGIYDVRSRHPVLNTVFGNDSAARTEASPITHVQEGSPPFLVVWAEHEMPGLAFSGRELVHRLHACGDAVESCELPGTDHVHYMFRFGQNDDPVTPRVAAFLRSCEAGTAKPVPPAPHRVKQTTGVIAGRQPIDLWLPEDARPGALLVLAAVEGEEERQAARLAGALAAGGAAVAVVHCGPAAAIRYPDGMRALASAVTALLDRADLALPADSLYLGGSSTGGWLAAGAGMHVELLGRQARGVVLFGVPGRSSVRDLLPELGAPEGSELTPEKWLRAGGPRVLAMWADRDAAAVLMDNRPFAARMIERDSPVTALEFGGRDTSACLDQVGSKADEITEPVLVFLGL